MEKLELKGRLSVKLPEQRGTSKAGKDWVKQDFVIETQDQYPKLICINVMGEDKIKLIENIKIGELITCSINIESREYNGKYYTSVSAWKIELIEKPQTNRDPLPISESQPDFNAPSGSDDELGLPF